MNTIEYAIVRGDIDSVRLLITNNRPIGFLHKCLLTATKEDQEEIKNLIIGQISNVDFAEGFGLHKKSKEEGFVAHLNKIVVD